ncbi:MAG: TonB-dependent receptor plug domain-containing protein [Novosphingobium sp.]
MRAHRLFVVGTGLIAMAQSAHAQTEPQDANAEIIVTAQRRDENLSRTPVAVTVVSADQLAKAQIVQANDLRQAAPGLSIRSGVSSEQLNFSLRGATQDPYSNVRPGVMPYVNDVQVGSQASSGAFYDLQSIQVLKGPQGTLFGRSATGGAILFTTQKPTNELGGYASGLVGNYGQAKGEAAINLPLVDDELLLRVAGFYSRRDGFQYNLYRGYCPSPEQVRPSCRLPCSTPERRRPPRR